jgi:ATP sulfurylase
MQLTDEQVENWKKVLVIMGLYSPVVTQLTKEDVEKIVTNIQLRLDMESLKCIERPILSKETQPKKDTVVDLHKGFSNKMRVRS